MEKLNGLGIELMNFKTEFLKDYNDFIEKALEISLKEFLKTNMIDNTTFRMVKDSSYSEIQLRNYLESKKEFCKTEEQLKEEMDRIRKDLDDLLINKNVNKDIITSKTIVSDEVFVISQTLFIDKNFIMGYFEPKESDFQSLMASKGFVEKFVTLRMVKVIKDISNIIRNKSNYFRIEKSASYLSKDRESYCIDIAYILDIKDFIIEEKREAIINNLLELSENVINEFIKRMHLKETNMDLELLEAFSNNKLKENEESKNTLETNTEKESKVREENLEEDKNEEENVLNDTNKENTIKDIQGIEDIEIE